MKLGEKNTYISFHEFGEVDIPNFEGNGESEQFNTSVIHLEEDEHGVRGYILKLTLKLSSKYLFSSKKAA